MWGAFLFVEAMVGKILERDQSEAVGSQVRMLGRGALMPLEEVYETLPEVGRSPAAPVTELPDASPKKRRKSSTMLALRQEVGKLGHLCNFPSKTMWWICKMSNP